MGVVDLCWQDATAAEEDGAQAGGRVEGEKRCLVAGGEGGVLKGRPGLGEGE